MSNWAPHFYRKTAESLGCPPDSIALLITEGNRLDALGIPVIFTLGHLASICGVPYDLLDKAVKRLSDPYRVFRMRKRSGGYRQICIPESYLLTVQHWIHKNILLDRPLHHVSMAFAPGCDPLTNANRHAGARWLVKLDVASFFESLSERQVYRVFRKIGYPALLAFQFTRLCTRTPQISPQRKNKYRKLRWKTRSSKYCLFASENLGHLPQGAPTSPMLANLICAELDEMLAGCASEFGCVVTRYADDIVFSASTLTRQDATEIIKRSSAIIGRFGLHRRNGKTHVSPPGTRRVVTGLLVDGCNPRLPKEFRERILLHLYHAKRQGLPEHCKHRRFRSLIGFRAHLGGLITYAEHVEPAFGAKCRAEFEALPWGDLSFF